MNEEDFEFIQIKELNESITVDSYLSFGNEPDFFAICNNTLYMKNSDGTYTLLKENFNPFNAI